MRLSFLCAGAAVGALVALGSATDARACGGCFHGPPPPNQTPDVITDHRMIFRISPQQTTLYDEIEYQGSAASFAWVLPTHGLVTVGLSSDVVFSVLDGLTQPKIYAPNPPQCASCPSCEDYGGRSADAGTSAGDASFTGPVTVLGQQTVGPYDTVQLSSTDPTALEKWLGANGYTIPTAVQPIIAAYVNEGFDFLVLRLAPGQGVSAMRPVRVTSPGAGLQLPLRMVAAGTGATVGITLWVMGDGRYEPQYFPTFTISASELTWDFNANVSNYTTLRAQKEQATNDTAWQIESVLQMSAAQFTGPIESQSASADYLPTGSAASGDAGSVGDAGATGDGGGETADQVRQDDIDILDPPATAPNSPWITRMRADLSQAALGSDLTLVASADQSQLSNVLDVTKYVNAPACPSLPDPCPVCPVYGDDGGPGDNASGGGSGGFFGSGCSTVGHGDDSNLGVELGGLLLAGIVAGRGRRKTRARPPSTGRRA